ncbi:MAG: ParA family protein [Desulfuromonas sp.]|nr:MAG: ParA family protein [Desulfuromonas sp.]
MNRPYVVAISSEKGGVGKTTLATNLAIYLKALHEDLPVTLCSFDNHFSVDRMFRINGSVPKANVASLFNGGQAEQILETGEFGVQFFPSDGQLSSIRDQISGPDVLARKLAATDLPGILVIDTRPDLDIFTQNALFCADQVIVPVKDAPSLENCKHLYDFFAANELGKSALRILPCLIDSRIHYDGPFRDPYQLLKAYAMSRGYRCLEGYIAKSPKVESLNTNPEGKIYPVITHGRSTDVHIQMSHITRQVYLNYADTRTKRLDRYADDMQNSLRVRDEEFSKRFDSVDKNCLICGSQIINDHGIDPVGYYATTFSGKHSAFIEDECLTSLVFRHFYRSPVNGSGSDPLSDLFRESAQHSFFVLRRAINTRNFHQQQIALYRFDEDGLEISHKEIELKEFEKGLINRERSALYTLAEKVLFGPDKMLGDDCLLIRKVCTDFPDEILYDEKHKTFKQISERIRKQFIEQT